MAYEWFHEFSPNFSGLMAAVFAVILVLGYISGRRSVKVRPRRLPGKDSKYYADEPRYRSKIISDLRYEYRFSIKRLCYSSDSTIAFCAEATDHFWSAVAAVVFGVVFFREHYDGLVQWCINHLGYSDAAIYGDWHADVIFAVLIIVVGFMFYGLRRLGRSMRAHKLVEKYLYDLKVRPVFFQFPSWKFIAEHTAWAISKTIEEHREEKAQKSQVISLAQHIQNAAEKLEERAQ